MLLLNTLLFYLYIMCIFVLIFNKKDKIMTTIFIFTHFGLSPVIVQINARNQTEMFIHSYKF